jgi:hypothetical protein
VRERSESEWFEEVLLEVVSRAACVGGNGGPGMVDMTESDDKALGLGRVLGVQLMRFGGL